MLSGIGPKAQLQKLGINTVVDRADVGQNLQDHPFVASQWSVVNATYDMYDTIFSNATAFGELQQQWVQSKTGPFVDTAGNHLGWHRIPSTDPVFKTNTDPSSGKTAPHYETLFAVSCDCLQCSSEILIYESK